MWLVEYNQREAQLYEFTDKLDDTKRAKKPACGLTRTEAQLKVIQLPKNLTKLTQQGRALQKQLFYSLVSVFLVTFQSMLQTVYKARDISKKQKD